MKIISLYIFKYSLFLFFPFPFMIPVTCMLDLFAVFHLFLMFFLFLLPFFLWSSVWLFFYWPVFGSLFQSSAMSSMLLNTSSDFLISDTVFLSSRMFIRFFKNIFQLSAKIHYSFIYILELMPYFLQHINQLFWSLWLIPISEFFVEYFYWFLPRNFECVCVLACLIIFWCHMWMKYYKGSGCGFDDVIFKADYVVLRRQVESGGYLSSCWILVLGFVRAGLFQMALF